LGANNNVTNTLPARVNHHQTNGGGSAGLHNGGAGPTGRHFKPFDHRRINLMAEIQEDPSAAAAAAAVAGEPIYQRPPVAPHQQQQQQNLIVQKSTNHPHMPAEVRHTNYNGGLGQLATQVQQQPRKMANPHILEHRDSANFSMASSDSG
jgi:hypothetical protein